MSPPSRLEQLSQWIAGNEKLIGELHEQVRALESLNETLRAALVKEESLTIGTERTNIRDMLQVQNGTGNGRKVGRPIESDHAFPAWLRSQNITVTEWARDHEDPETGKPYKRERVKSWFAAGDGGRPAPRHAVDAIEKESTDPETKKSAVPATRRVWKNGIRE